MGHAPPYPSRAPAGRAQEANPTACSNVFHKQHNQALPYLVTRHQVKPFSIHHNCLPFLHLLISQHAWRDWDCILYLPQQRKVSHSKNKQIYQWIRSGG